MSSSSPAVPLPHDPDLLWDVIVIGGGPAGSTAATVLAKAGRRVLVLEKCRFPRFHVGESLLPYNREIFEDLGVWPALEAAGFMVKRGAQFLMGNGSRRVRLDFSAGCFTEWPQAIQVERAEFDDILLRHSRQSGATVREECLVLEHRITAGTGVMVRYRDASGTEHAAAARFLVDASGLSNFTASRAALRGYYPGHRKLAVFGHFGNVLMGRGEEEGDILIVRRENSWFWMIPLGPDKTSVGLVLDHAEFKSAGADATAIFQAAVDSTEEVRQRFSRAEALTELHTVTDFSYHNRELAAPHVVRVGDASGFIDPIFSSGVLLAMTSGRQAAREVHAALEKGHPLTAGLKRYGTDNRRRIALYWKFIENFYRNPFAQLFFQPHPRWKMLCAINCVLAGRTELPWAVRWRLRLFFALARLNRHVPVAPRISVS